MIKYDIEFDAFDDHGNFPLGVVESKYGHFDTYEEAREAAIKILNKTKEYTEKLLKRLKKQ